MSNANHDQLPTIAPAVLAQVSGGAAQPTSNEDVLTALTGILESIQSLAAQPRGGTGFSEQEMMMLVMMMQQRNEAAAMAAATAASPWSQQPIVRYV